MQSEDPQLAVAMPEQAYEPAGHPLYPLNGDLRLRLRHPPDLHQQNIVD